jgi:ketosteroid isomerase-like protein
MGDSENARLLLDVFGAIERRDDQRFRELVTPDFEIAWPPSAPLRRNVARCDASGASDLGRNVAPSATDRG